MSSFPTFPKSKRPRWQTLLAPMLLASLGLHGLFLLIPVASSDEAAIPPPDPEEDNIAITRIPPAAADAAPSQPVAAATATPQTVPQRPVQATTQPRAVARPRASSQTPATRTAPNRTVARTTNVPSAGANQAELPSLPGQGNSTDGSSTARVNSPNPDVPPPEPTIPTLGQDRRETILAYVAGLNLPEERMNQLAATVWQRYGYSTLDTSRGEYTDNLTQWQAMIQQETGLADLVAEEDRTDFSVEMERRVCLVRPPGEVKVGFVVNPDGSFRQAPVLLRSSGYDELNQKALDTIQQYNPAADDDIKAYTVTVETAVDYGPNDCLDSPQQPSGTSAET